LGKPASTRTVHWLAPCIARWLAQRRARRGNAYSVGYADLVCFREAWSMRGIVHSECILFIAATSRRRHEPSAPSPSRHRCRVRVVRVNKKTMPDKTPAPAFSLPHTTLRVRLGRCALCFIVPAQPSLSGCAGSRCAAPFPLTCHASHPPQGAPSKSKPSADFFKHPLNHAKLFCHENV